MKSARRKKSAVFGLVVALTAMLLLFSFSASGVAAQSDTTTQAPPDGAPPPEGFAPPGDMSAAGGTATNPVLTSTCGVITLDGTSETQADQTYDSTAADQSDLCAINGASLTLTNATITKSGDSSSSDQSSFYGLNAALLAGSGSTVTMSGGTITTNGSGTNGVFSTGEGTTVFLSDLTIDDNGGGAHAVMATLGGAMTLTNVTMNTTGANSGAVATDRGSGTIGMIGGSVVTSGQDSPGIYSTGAITVSDATISASGAEAAVIEGANSIILTDTDLSSSFADKWGVMIYQSFSGDAEGSDGTFTMTGGSLVYSTVNGPLFFVTNANAYITLTGVEVSAASGILVQAEGTDRWGTSGANGGTVYLTADAQTLEGDLAADSISALNVTLQNGSALTGAINADNAAQSASLTLDAGSTWTVTADSYLSGFADADGISGTSITNVVGNGHIVTYDATNAANSALGGQTYTLVGGGTLQPAA